VHAAAAEHVPPAAAPLAAPPVLVPLPEVPVEGGVPPPPPAALVARHRAVPQNWTRIDHENGYLRMSKTRGKTHWDFRAVCGVHGVCTLTRYGNKEDIPDGSPAGRPLGFLWCFLQKASGFTSKEEHRDFGAWATHANRSAAREALRTVGGSAYFFREERRPRLGEADEPDLYPA
jgi:hypothetical protein